MESVTEQGLDMTGFSYWIGRGIRTLREYYYTVLELSPNQISFG
jgi:hypothetical protein